MPVKINYQLEMEKVLRAEQGNLPRLLLHCCCAPCSSFVLESLASHFAITAHYYNPNIDTAQEYALRSAELQRFVKETVYENPVDVLCEAYDPASFYAAVKGLEAIPEGGARCYECYRLRLLRTAQIAHQGGYDYFTTTLSISPHKNAEWLNTLGQQAAEQFHVKWLPSDFKKKNGFKRSTILAAEHGLYRQDYCGCVFSKREAENRARQKAQAENTKRSTE